MNTLLVVDDESNVRYSLKSSLESESLTVITASTATQGIESVQRDRPDVVVLDVRLPDMSGLDAFHQIRAIDPRLPVIMITAYTTTETAIEAMRSGAFEYLLKPVNFRELRDVIRKAIEVSRLTRVPAVIDEADEETTAADRIVGRSLSMQSVYKAIGRVARQDVTVLIQGESGTGKELVARAIFHYSQRNHMPFLAINCAAIPESLLESELFGHERGAFTGAESRRIGKFEQANGGSIFLDEIADMSPATQAKVLRLLQEQRFERIGSNETIQTDVRVVAASNQNLEQLVALGRFRQDLLYRLNVFTIQLPPLRDRLDDLPLLVDHFLRMLQSPLGKRIRMVTEEAQEALRRYPWPGNVRELQSAIKYAMVHATGGVLTADCLPDFLRTPNAIALTPAIPGKQENSELAQYIHGLLRDRRKNLHRLVHAEVDRILINLVLGEVKGNQQDAAEILGISRTTLRAKLRALGMAVEKQLMPDSGHDDQLSSPY